MILTDVCVDPGDALGEGDGVDAVCVTTGELELFDAGVQAVVTVNVAIRLKSKMRGSKLIVWVLSFVINCREMINVPGLRSNERSLIRARLFPRQAPEGDRFCMISGRNPERVNRDRASADPGLLAAEQRVGIDVCAFPVTLWIGDRGDREVQVVVAGAGISGVADVGDDFALTYLFAFS